MTSKEILRAADERLARLLDGVSTVADAAARLAADPQGLRWLRTDYRRGDLRSTLSRVSPLPADDVIVAYQAILRSRARAADTAYYAGVARADNAAALQRGAPRPAREDD